MLKIFSREKNKKAEDFRKEGKIPGVIYGPNIESQTIYALVKDLYSLYKEHEGGLFEIDYEGKKLQGILREIQFHPLTNQLIHFDIYIPSLEREIEVKIPLEFVGEAPVLMKGGVLNFNLKEIEISALPQDIPEKIEVDVSHLEEIGQTIYVKDLKIPAKIKVLLEPDLPVVTVISEAGEETPIETTTT
ncbi:MAG: 50S ribosomal protein L25 [Candidatus Parcubacteria bacterium]|nr:MAG: 50S ribosomal protein L25 [Candidatus Parcubacteria bacterium]